MTKAPRPPQHLDATARKKWREIMPQLPDNEPATLDLLTCYATAWSALLSSSDDQDRVRWMRAVRQIAAELGLSPKAKAPRRTAQQSDDPIFRLIRTGDTQ